VNTTSPVTTDPVLHLTGPVLLGPDQELAEAWVVAGRIRHDRPELPSSTPLVRVDGYVVPGLADLHCHVGIGQDGEGTTLDGARAQARTDRDTGVLLIRDAGSIIDTTPLQREYPSSAIDPADAQPGPDPMPRLIRCGRHVARTRRYLKGYAREVEPAQLERTVAQEAGRSDGWVKLVGDWIDRTEGDLTPCWSADDFRRAADAAHAAGARITTHTFDEDTLPSVLAAGFDCLEHATGLTDATIRAASAAGTPVVTTLVNVGEFETYARQGERKFPRYATHMRRLRAGRYERTRDAHDAGIPLLVGTDAGGVLGHGIIHDELDELARCGLDGTEILQAASWGPRRFLGVPGLQDGDPADLLVLAADPRTDHRTLRRPRKILLGGRRVR
jgi:imidazolonepropionase-like amidohydrolase